MKKEEHIRDLISVGRTWLIIMMVFFIINLLGLSYFYPEDFGFLFWFNFTCFIGIGLFICWLDYNKYKIIYGEGK